MSEAASGDKFAAIKQRLRDSGYKGAFTIEMLALGAAILRYTPK